MEILRLIYDGYNKQSNTYAKCILLIQRRLFSYTVAYDFTVKNGYPICSEAHIDMLIEALCEKEGGDLWDAYSQAKINGSYFIHFANKNVSGCNPFNVPRFSEKDFQNVITELGGNKIPESTIKTPDFLLNKVIYELKDIQTDSLFNKDRQNKIGEIFRNNPKHFIDLNPEINHGQESLKYYQTIKNTIQTHIKKASEQIKAYKTQNEFNSAGLILLNTGMFSLPHKLFVKFVEQSLNNTKTVDFVYIFSQNMQGSWFDLYANYASDFIGALPDGGDKLKKKVGQLINSKMTDMARGGQFESIIDQMHPISFEANNQIFYWNPGAIPSTLPKTK